MHDDLKNALEAAISEATDTDFSIERTRAQGGGCINEATIVSGAMASYFIKFNSAGALPMFEAEAQAMSELAAADAIRVPQALSHGTATGRSYLILEALPFGSPQTDLAFSEFFGGFPASFYRAYDKDWALTAGYERRKLLYKLYHVLNHANLFGGGYGRQAESMIQCLSR